jgi:hypothetical protein
MVTVTAESKRLRELATSLPLAELVVVLLENADGVVLPL